VVISISYIHCFVYAGLQLQQVNHWSVPVLDQIFHSALWKATLGDLGFSDIRGFARRAGGGEADIEKEVSSPPQ
jgi:hypothetical protein